MNNDAQTKVRMLKNSLRCFTFGLLALIPVFGFPFALASLWLSGQVRRTERQFWNAARAYRLWGVVCSAAGTIFWMLIGTLIAYQAVSNH